MKEIKIAIASGKGGTGKTTCAVNLAYAAQMPITLMDCDTEAPNAHLFFKTPWEEVEPVLVDFPYVIEELCDGCGVCKDHCRFNAMIILDKIPLISKELCHMCGACLYACPKNAIKEKPREIGRIRKTKYDLISLISGELNIGEARSSALIERLRDTPIKSSHLIVDSPPGTSCATIAAIEGIDYLVLVTEPTRFGFHDFKLAIELAEKLGLKTGVIINKCDIGKEPVQDYCLRKNITVLGEFPYDAELATIYSEGELISELLPKYQELFANVFKKIIKEIDQ